MVLLCGTGLAALLPCGCGGDDKATPKTTKIAWIPKEQGNQVFQTGLDGARSRALELSKTSGKQVQILYDELNIPATAADVAGQAASVQKAVELKADAIAVSCSGTAVSPAVDAAVAAGVPVMSWDSDCLEPTTGLPSQRFAYYGIDNYATGQTVTRLAKAVLLQNARPKPWKMAILSGVPLASNLQQRVAGMWKVMKNEGACVYRVDATGASWTLRKCWKNDAPYSGDAMDGTQIAYHVFEDKPALCPTTNGFDTIDGDACATAYCYDETANLGLENAACAPIMNTVTTQARNGVQIDGFLLVGLWPLIGYEDPTQATAVSLAGWAARMGTGLVSVTYDTLPFQLDLLKKNLLNALVGQKYWAWGYNVTQMVFDQLQGTQNYAGFIDSGADIVCANNVDAMSQAWTSQSFNTPLPACSLAP
jgi:ribose transport system substrate-binding protein